MSSPQEKRFRRKTRRRKDGHIIWTGGVQFRMADGRRLSPSAAAYEIAHGYRSPTGVAMRSCDVAGCVAHVSAADYADGWRWAGNRKLTAGEVAIIRGLKLKRGNTGNPIVRELARHMGIAVRTLLAYRVQNCPHWPGVGR